MKRNRSRLIASLALLLVMSTTTFMQSSDAERITKNDLIKTLEYHQKKPQFRKPTSWWIEKVQRFGVDFGLTPQDELRIRELAGYLREFELNQLILVIKDRAPKPVLPPFFQAFRRSESDPRPIQTVTFSLTPEKTILHFNNYHHLNVSVTLQIVCEDSLMIRTQRLNVYLSRHNPRMPTSEDTILFLIENFTSLVEQLSKEINQLNQIGYPCGPSNRLVVYHESGLREARIPLIKKYAETRGVQLDLRGPAPVKPPYPI